MEQMRKKERELSREEGLSILKHAEYGVLALNGTDGYPHAIPISFAMANGILYFHTAQEGYKIRCIEASNACCFTVVGDTQVLPEAFSTVYESCMVYGQLLKVPDDMRDEAFEAILKKYSLDYLEEGKRYVARAGHKTNLYQLNTDQMSVKGRK